METPGLDACILQLRLAAQALWDFRTKGPADLLVSNFLEPGQKMIADTLGNLEVARDFLKSRANEG